MRRSIACALALGVLAAAPQSDITSWLDRYERRDYAVVGDARTMDIKTFSKRLSDAAPRCVSAAGASAVERRRLVAATLALEVVQPVVEDALTAQDGMARNVIEWGCRLVRANPKPTEAEHWWHLAALALSEQLFDEYFLTGYLSPQIGSEAAARIAARYGGNRNHLSHAENRFPDEARFKLGRLVTTEVHITMGAWGWLGQPSEAVRQAAKPFYEDSVRKPDNNQRRRLIGGYAELAAASEAVRAEAHVRAGVLEFRLGQYDAALGQLRQAQANTQEAALLYLSHFFRAKVLERRGGEAEAEAEYRAALRAMPMAQSAVTALSAWLFLRDAREEAYELTAASLAVRPVPVDPWREYWCGDCRLWPALIARLREELR